MEYRLYGLKCGMILLGLMCGCNDNKPHQIVYDFPSVLPIWIVEDDPNTTIFDRKDLKRDRKVGKMMVIPLYDNFTYAGGTDALAIAHPFVYEQGEDIEKHLSSLGQRENLRRLIFWVPGYFPDGLGRSYWWMPIINGKKMIVIELQRCIGTEEREINEAMRNLLLQEHFVVGKTLYLKGPPPPYAETAIMSDDSYDASEVVRSEYAGRYFYHDCPENSHSPWGFSSGTKIVNHLSPAERRIVEEFALPPKQQKKK